jgi:hypothetical protein
MTAATAQSAAPEFHFPDSLMERDQWGLWCYDQDGKKIPLQVNGEPASSTDPGTWATFEAALNAYRKNPKRFAGICFFFSKEDPFAGIDIDDCLDDAGQLMEWAQPIVEKLYDTYLEVSPGGHGLKAFVCGKLAKAITDLVIADGQIELYDHARFFTTTGRRFNDAPLEVEEHQETIDWLIRLHRFQGDAKRSGKTKPEVVHNIRKFVDAIVECECTAVHNASPGEQNTSLNKAAFTLGRLVGADHLDQKFATNQLFEAAQAMQNEPGRKPWKRNELLRIIKCGLRAGILKPRWLEEEQQKGSEPQQPEKRTKPKPMAQAAYYGLPGDFVRALDGQTEAAREGILVQFLVGAGVLLDREAYYPVESDRHYTNLFAAIVGPTSKGRKGTGLGHTKRVMALTDHSFVQNCADAAYPPERG